MSVNEPSNDSPAEGIAGAMDALRDRPTFLRVMIVLAATVVVLVVVFLSFVFWAWLLGGPGAFLALPITLFVAVMFDTFPETRWLANLIGISSPDPPGAATPESKGEPAG